MDDLKIVIDPGHGGSDPGAVANGVNEKDLTLMISKYMYDRLQQLGIPVYITRTEDITLTPSQRVNSILNAFGNNPNVLVISNHINSNATPNSAEGAEVIYALRNNGILANKILDELGETGQIKRTAYQKRSEKNPQNDYYFIHRETGNTEPLIIEYGFINNEKDLEKLQNNYKEYVDAVIDAILDVKNIKLNNTNNNNLNMSNESYIVKQGDSLWEIAQKYNTTVNELKKKNNLISDVIVPGQILQIPKGDVNTMYVVKPGDSLWKIAQNYGVSVEELAMVNDISNDFLTIGQILTIPNRMKKGIEYVVKPSDTLWSISQKYGISVEALKNANGLIDNIIYVDQVLKIPKGVTNTMYTVSYGDTLWSIAQKYGITVEKLKEINNLNSNIIYIGQILKIY